LILLLRLYSILKTYCELSLSKVTHIQLTPTMSSIDFHAKLSGHEAKEWIRACLSSAGKSFEDDEQFIDFIASHKPTDFKVPRKARASKKSSSDRADSDYECHLCDARVWNDGLGAQCTRKKIDGKHVCTIHHKESTKNNGNLRNGYVTEDRPTHAYGDESQQLLPWHDVTLPEKKSKKTSGPKKSTRKCSNCGECGHNKKTCPHLKVTSDNEETKEVITDVLETITHQVQSLHISEPNDDNDTTSTETEFLEARSNLKKIIDDKDPESTLEEDEPEPEPESTLEEDESESNTITFEGIDYTLDTEDSIVYDDELAQVGTWTGQAIEFDNASAAKLHRVRKLALKND